MRLIYLFLIAVPVLLTARENPFAPSLHSDVNVTYEKSETVSTVIETDAIADFEEPVIEQGLETVIDEEPKNDPSLNTEIKKVVNYAQARFVFRDRSVYIETKDRMIRHFTIANPPSIVIDFEAASDFASKREALETGPFVKLEMGAHDDYYRVVLRLDGPHQYTIESQKYGEVVTIQD